MRNSKVFVCGFILCFCLFLNAAHAADKFAYVDLTKVFSEYVKTKDFDKALGERQKAYEAERDKMINELKQLGQKMPDDQQKIVFLAQVGDLAKRKSLRLLEMFRKAKVPVAESLSKDSLKVQLSRADRLKVRYSLIIGQKEALDKTVILRDMQKGTQDTIKMEKVVHEIQRRTGK